MKLFKQKCIKVFKDDLSFLNDFANKKMGPKLRSQLKDAFEVSGKPSIFF